MLAKGNSNRQEAKELTQLIDDLKNSSLRTDPELSQLEIKHAELEKELENVKAAILCRINDNHTFCGLIVFLVSDKELI